MRSANSLINKRYFFFKTKQILPYAIIMTLVGVATTFVMNLSSALNSYDMYFVFSEWKLLFPSWALMYVYPILFALFLFSFMHKKNASDLFSAAPITKREYYLTNMLIAAIYFAAMILISVLTANIFSVPNSAPQAIAFDAFVKIFLFLFLGFMQVYTITTTASVLTGTIPAQLFTAATFLLVPTALLIVFQFPNSVCIDFTFTTNYELGKAFLELNGEPINSLIYPINIGTSPLSIIGISAISTNIIKAYGAMTHFMSAPAMLYTLGLIIVYAVIGVEFFTKYKMENVERPFINEKFGLVIRATVFIPLITFLVMIYHNDGSVFNIGFITLFVVVTVAYIVADLILRKGIKGFSKSLATYGIVMVASLVFGITLGIIGEANNDKDPTLIDAEDITKITVYMEPLNMTPYNDENVKKYGIPVEITDEKIISRIIGNNKEESYNGGNRYWVEITENGRKHFAMKNIGGVALDSIYGYIDENPDVKKTLIINTGMSKHVKASAILTYSSENYRNGKTFLTEIDKNSIIRKLRNDFESTLMETPCKEIYGAKQDKGFIDNYSMASERAYFGSYNSQMIMSEVKYSNGMYYLSATEIPYESDIFNQIFKSFNNKNTKLCVKKEYASFSPIGTINLDEEQILNLTEVLNNIPKLLSKDFREVVINAIDKEIIYENSIIYSASYRGEVGYFILNYERDIAPLVEKYYDAVCNIIVNKATNCGYSCYQYGETLIGNIGPSNSQAALDELKNNIEKIKELSLTKYSDDNIPIELFKGYVNYRLNYDIKEDLTSISFVLDNSFTSVLDIYLTEKEFCNNITEIEIQHRDFDKKVKFNAEDGEIFEILKQSAIFDRLDKNYNYDMYYEKYGHLEMSSDSYTSSFYPSEVYYVEYKTYEYSFDADIKYSDGTEETTTLRLGDLAYDKLMDYSFNK